MLIGYTDHCSLAATVLSLDEGTAVNSITSVNTRQLSDQFVVDPVTATVEIKHTFSEDKDVRLVAILASDTPDSATINVILNDSTSTQIDLELVEGGRPFLSDYTKVIWVDFGQTYTNVREVVLQITSGLSSAIGRIWAGPVIAPTYPGGAKYSWAVDDPSGLAISRGGQAYPENYARLRTAHLALPALTQVEAFGEIVGGSPAGRTQNFQDLMFAVGTHAELVLLPHEGEAQHENKMGMYCHAARMGELQPVVEGNTEALRKFSLDLDLLEER